MPFTATTFNSGAAPGIDAPVLNAMGTQYLEATNSFEQDMFAPFVLSGFVATKDGTTASQLDVTSGVAFLTQADGTERRRSAGALTYSTVGHASTTMFLDLNPDGTWSWNTTHSGVANFLPIASVTTDVSANISTVTDARTLNTTFMSGMAGDIDLPPLTGGLSVVSGATSLDGGKIATNGAGRLIWANTLSASNQIMDWQQGWGLFSDNTASTFAGATNRLWINAGGATGTQEVHIGPRVGASALAGLRVLTNNVTFETGSTPGVFKVSSGITTSLDAGNITTDGQGTLRLNSKWLNWQGTLSGVAKQMFGFAPTDVGTKSWGVFYNTDNGISFYDATDNKTAFKVFPSGGILTDNGALTTDGSGNLSTSGFVSGTQGYFSTGVTYGAVVSGSQAFITHDTVNHYNTYWTPQAAANHLAHVIVGWTGAAQVNLLQVGGASNTSGSRVYMDENGNINANGFVGFNANTGIPTTRNGASFAVPIYTGTTTPTSPPTGSIWIKS